MNKIKNASRKSFAGVKTDLVVITNKESEYKLVPADLYNRMVETLTVAMETVAALPQCKEDSKFDRLVFRCNRVLNDL